MSTQCAYCGATVPPHSMFCPECGQLVTGRAPAAVPPPLGGLENTGTIPPAPRSVIADTAPPPPVPLPPMIGAPPSAPTPPVAPPAPPAPPPPPAPPAPPPAPPAAVAPVAPVAPPAPRLGIRFPDGTEVSVEGRVVLGRKPTAELSPAGHAPVVVPDPERSVSRVHAAIDATGPEAVVTDLGSPNGTELERAGVRTEVHVDPVVLQSGDRLWLGRVSIDVV